MLVYSKCSDYASDICPCILAESGRCIVCSMCRDEDFCDCTDTVSFCVLQELINNGGKARKRHEVIPCTVVNVKKYESNLCLIRLNVPGIDMASFRRLGCYVIVRVDEDPYFDVPVSVLNDVNDNGTIGLLIQVRGIKTGRFETIKKGDTVFLRGPFFNGIQSVRRVAGFHNGKALVLCRGIGMLPSIQVIEALRNSNNEVTVYLDRAQFNQDVLDAFMQLFEIEVPDIHICNEKGNLTEDYCQTIEDAVKNGTGLIHLGMSDYLIRKSVEFMEDRKCMVDVSCINNANICCGEGICGACTDSIGPNRIIRHCKNQLSMDDIRKFTGETL